MDCLYNDTIEDDFDMDSYLGNPYCLGPAFSEMCLSGTMWVEGPSDEDNYKELFPNLRDLEIQAIRGGKPGILKYFDSYIGQKHEKEEFFCIDRDSDNFYEPKHYDDSEYRLYYQMCERGRAGGFNDLECFQISTAYLDNALANGPFFLGDCVENVRSQVIDAAAFVGSLRFASRKVKGVVAKRVLHYEIADRDPFSGDANRGKDFPYFGEIDPRFFFDRGLVKIRDGIIKIDRRNAYKKIRGACSKSAAEDINRSFEIAGQILTEIAEKGNGIDYCRGHDLTYFLAKLMNSMKGFCVVPTRKKMEEYLSAWPFSSSLQTRKQISIMENYEIMRALKKASAV